MIINQGLFKLDFDDHHAVLGLPINSDSRAARKRYLQIARRLHPDSLATGSEIDKQQASEVLSKLVNPAYETLNQEKLATEYMLVLKLRGQQLGQDSQPQSLTSDEARALLRSNNIDADYRRSVLALAQNQYDHLDQVSQVIGTLSELNLVYLMRTVGQEGTTARPATAAMAGTSSAAAPTASTDTPSAPPRRSREIIVDSYINRAKEFEIDRNYGSAILEMRQALKTYPNSAACHSYIASLYLKSGQTKMAGVHARRAVAINPDDQQGQAIQAQLEKVSKQAAKSEGSASSNSGGGFFGLFGGKKK